MIVAAIRENGTRQGASRKVIQAYIAENFDVQVGFTLERYIRNALRRGIDSGKFEKEKGNYKLPTPIYGIMGLPRKKRTKSDPGKKVTKAKTGNKRQRRKSLDNTTTHPKRKKKNEPLKRRNLPPLILPILQNPKPNPRKKIVKRKLGK